MISIIASIVSAIDWIYYYKPHIEKLLVLGHKEFKYHDLDVDIFRNINMNFNFQTSIFKWLNAYFPGTVTDQIQSSCVSFSKYVQAQLKILSKLVQTEGLDLRLLLLSIIIGYIIFSGALYIMKTLNSFLLILLKTVIILSLAFFIYHTLS